MELKRLLGGLDEGLERGGIGDSQLGDGLAVHLDASLLQAVHEAGIVDAERSDRRRNTGDPQLTELALLQLAAILKWVLLEPQ